MVSCNHREFEEKWIENIANGKGRIQWIILHQTCLHCGNVRKVTYNLHTGSVKFGVWKKV